MVFDAVDYVYTGKTPRRQYMSNFSFVRGKDGNVIGSRTKDESTGVVTIRDRHGDVLGYEDERRAETRGPDGNLLRRDGHSSFLLK